MESRCVSDEEVKPEAAVEGEKAEINSQAGDGPSGKGAVEESDRRSGHVGGFVAQKAIHAEDAENERSATVPSPGSSPLTPTTQLTIFYGGRVNVFDGIPPEKVREILLIAAAAANSVETRNVVNGNSAASPSLTRSPSLQSSAAMGSPGSRIHPVRQTSFCRLQKDLPIARRQSLQRFLEKRKDRLGNKNPYPAPDMKKNDEKAVDRCTEPPSDAKILGSLDGNKPQVVAHVA